MGGTPTRIKLGLQLKSAFAAESSQQMHRHLRDAETSIMKLRRLVAKTLPKKPRVIGARGCLCKLNIQVTKSPAKQHRPR